MNYFAHGIRFLDRPYFLAGTAVPDWLSVADRRVRMRSRRVTPWANGPGDATSEIAKGVLQHLDDDQWFHSTPAFVETSTRLAVLFREALGPEDGMRPGFLGHITTELLLDAVLIERHPRAIDAYYEAVASVDPDVIQSTVNRMAKHETTRLAELIPLFCREQFLRDYVTAKGLLHRLNQVMRRVKLGRLPDEIEDVLESGRDIVESRAGKLLPAPIFSGIW